MDISSLEGLLGAELAIWIYGDGYFGVGWRMERGAPHHEGAARWPKMKKDARQEERRKHECPTSLCVGLCRPALLQQIPLLKFFKGDLDVAVSKVSEVSAVAHVVHPH